MGALGDAHPPVVEKRAAALGAGKELVLDRVIHDGMRDLPAIPHSYRHAKLRKAVDEVGGAVERVDDPGVLVFRAARVLARFLGEDRVVGVRLAHNADDGRFGGLVDLGDEIVGALGLHLEAARDDCAIDERSGAAGRLDGGVQHRMHVFFFAGP